MLLRLNIGRKLRKLQKTKPGQGSSQLQIYLDQAAAARPSRDILDYYRSRLEENFANQEAAHGLGYETRRRLDAAAEQLSAALFGGERRAVVWGMSGTELFGLAADSPLAAGRAIVSSRLEHPALLANLRRTAGKLTLLGAGRDGGILPEPAAGAEFAAFHLVQSELGRIQDPEIFGRTAPGAVRLLDAIQAAGRIPIPAKAAELVVVSGHKFGAPGGAAILVDPKAKCAKAFLDFAQRYRHADYRIGRPEPAVLLTMAYAAELRRRELETAAGKARRLNRFLRDSLAGLSLPGGRKSFCTIPEELASPWILHLMLPGIETGVAVRMLSEAGILVAAGSACSSESREPSPALLAVGFRRDEAWSGLRVSFGPDSTPEDAEKFVEALRNVLKNW